MVKVHYDEGVAIHIDPESCAGGREAVREALTGARTGQPSSRERSSSGCRRRPDDGRQHGQARYASGWTIRRGRRTWHVRTLLVREPGDLPFGRLNAFRAFARTGDCQTARIGKARSRRR